MRNARGPHKRSNRPRIITTEFCTKDSHFVMPRTDAASSVVKYRDAWEFRATRFRVKRGMTINRRFFKKLNEYSD